MDTRRLAPPSSGSHRIPEHFIVRRGPEYVACYPGTITRMPALARNWCRREDAEEHASRMNKIQSGWEVVTLNLQTLDLAA